MKTSMVAFALMATASMFSSAQASDNCAKFKAQLVGTTVTVIEPKLAVLTEQPLISVPTKKKLDTAFYAGQTNVVPTVKKWLDGARTIALKPGEALVDNGKLDGHVSTMLMATAEIDTVDVSIKVQGIITPMKLDGDELGMKLTF